MKDRPDRLDGGPVQDLFKGACIFHSMSLYPPVGVPGFFVRARRCCTCSYWDGKRSTKLSEHRVLVERHSTPGQCSAPRGPGAGHRMEASQTCGVWQPWDVIKDYVGPGPPPKTHPPETPDASPPVE